MLILQSRKIELLSSEEAFVSINSSFTYFSDWKFLLRFFTGDVGLSGSSMSLLCKSIKPLKYLTVFTLSSIVASSSQTNMVCACCWNAETVHMWFTPSSIALCKANALWTPVIKIITWKLMFRWSIKSKGVMKMNMSNGPWGYTWVMGMHMSNGDVHE